MSSIVTKQQINKFLNNHTNKTQASSSLFSNQNQQTHNDQRENKGSSILSKRENFSNEIRRKQKQQIKKNMRIQIMKSLQNNNILQKLQQMANKNSIDTKNILQFLNDLKQSISEYDFCTKLKQSQLIKQYLLDLYILSKQSITIQQKSLLIQILIYLTYYGSFTLDQGQKQKLTDQIINQLQKINTWKFNQMDYLNKLIDLLTNITADKDENFNLYLVDTKIFYLIAEKITQIMDQAQKNIICQSKNQQIQQKYIQQLNYIRESFLGTLLNLSKYQNEFFFKFAINQLVNDRNYIESFPIRVVQIFINFFQHEKFTTNFFENEQLFSWFEEFIPFICQKKFQDIKQRRTGKFQNFILSQNQKQLFYQFLCCLMTFVYNQGENYLYTKTLIQENINLFCLSEFLIQSAGNGDQIYKVRRNSVYVSKAIQIYEYLACNPYRSVKNLLKVTSQRSFQGIIKVLLDKTYFTSCKISDVTISLLNKIISKDNQMLSTFMQLRILDSIDSFLEGDIQIQTKQQIINFLQLLTLMIVAEDQSNRKDRKTNEIVRLLEMKGFIKRIQRYQDHKERQVSDKAQAFLSHLDTYRQGNFRQENVVEI